MSKVIEPEVMDAGLPVRRTITPKGVSGNPHGVSRGKRKDANILSRYIRERLSPEKIYEKFSFFLNSKTVPMREKVKLLIFMIERGYGKTPIIDSETGNQTQAIDMSGLSEGQLAAALNEIVRTLEDKKDEYGQS
jgi:hypothetical protein